MIMLESRTILVADDAPVMRFAMVVVLQGAGASVIEASNGIEALEYARTKHPDLLLLDVQMPGMSGIEVCEALRAEAFATPILALCSADENLRNRCLAAGMNAVLPKPCSKQFLLEQILFFIGCQSQIQPAWEQISFPSFRDFCAGDEAFMRRLLDIASKVLPKTAQEIRAAIAAGNVLQIGALAHRVRSSVEGLGLTLLADSLREIERLARVAGQEPTNIIVRAQNAAYGLEEAARSVVIERFRLQATKAVRD